MLMKLMELDLLVPVLHSVPYRWSESIKPLAKCSLQCMRLEHSLDN